MSITGEPERRAAEGRRRARRRARRAVRHGRHPRRARATATAPERASGSRSTSCPRCSPRWSTRPPPTPRRASSRARMGNAHPSIAPYELFRTARRRAGPRRRQRPPVRRALRRARSCPSSPRDPRFATNPARVEHREALRADLEAGLAARPAADWARQLAAAPRAGRRRQRRRRRLRTRRLTRPRPDRRDRCARTAQTCG